MSDNINYNLKERIDWTRTPFNDGQTYRHKQKLKYNIKHMLY